MPVPKRKVSKSRRNMRRAHLALSALNFSKCPSCSAHKLPHSVCESCGFYKGRYVHKNFLNSSLR